MKLKIFYQFTNLPGWQKIAQERINKLTDSGLLDNAELNVLLHYNKDDYNELIKNFNHPNINWLYSDAMPDEFEHPTAILMQNTVLTEIEPFYALYIHQKGITKTNTNLETNMDHWRWLMDYWCIENWKLCIDKLNEGFNIVGCNLSYNPTTHFSGNQYWAKSEFIFTWPKLKLPSSFNFKPQIQSPMNNTRYDVEFWYGRCPDLKPCTLFNSDVDHYKQLFPPELYRNDIKK